MILKSPTLSKKISFPRNNMGTIFLISLNSITGSPSARGELNVLLGRRAGGVVRHG
jgi:hypothetical protein